MRLVKASLTCVLTKGLGWLLDLKHSGMEPGKCGDGQVDNTSKALYKRSTCHSFRRVRTSETSNT